MIPARLALSLLAVASAAAALTATDGSSIEFPPRVRHPRPVVVIFTSTVCPVANDYHRRIEQLWRDFHESTDFLVVYPNRTESLSQIRDHAAAMRFPFPVYRDDGNLVADLAGAQITPDSAVFVHRGGDSAAVAYRGPIDDASNPARVKTAWLRNAIRATLRGRPARAYPTTGGAPQPYG